MAEHYAGRRYIYDETNDLDHKEFGQDHGSVVVWKRPGVKRDQFFRLDSTYTSNVTRIYEITSDRLGSELVYRLDSHATRPLIPLRLIGSFFGILPARLGHNLALDDAVSCLCTIYAGTIPTSYNRYNIDKGIYRSYAKALSSLRASLSDPSLQMESETLCASILLSLCELVVNVNRGKWNHLVQGTYLLLKHRGVHRYTNAFDRTLLESQFGFILAQSFRFMEEPFLCSSEWQFLLAQRPTQQISQSTSLSLRNQLCGILFNLPGIIKRSSTIEKDVGRREGECARLLQEAVSMFGAVETFLEKQAEPFFASQRPSEYPDILAGVVDCVAHTALLTIHKLFRSLYNAAQMDEQEELKALSLLTDSETFDSWRQRATAAFKYVQGQSHLAAKPLDYGLRFAGCNWQ